MSRSFCVLALSLLVCAALAAPAPEPFVSGWGNPVNPDRDCKIRRNNGALTIEMPGTDHDYDPIRKRFNAARLLRDIEDDFEIQVRVRIESSPSSHSTVTGQPSSVSAGFLLIYPETGQCICHRTEYGVLQEGIGLDRFAVAPNLAGPQLGGQSRKGIGEDGYAAVSSFFWKKTKDPMVWDRECPGLFHMICDCGWKNWPFPKKTDYAYLRLEQRDIWIKLFISPDGEKWTRVSSHSGQPRKFKLGLAAYSTSSEPSKVRFDQLKFWRSKKKKQ
jgi:hypothetical protein